LKLLKETRVLQTDATYKLTWHGFPVIIVGFSDKNEPFIHLLYQQQLKKSAMTSISFSIQFNMDLRLCFDRLKNVSLVADAADAITKRFKYTFGKNFKRGNCSFHVIKDIDKYVSI
jgi:hypothetical protein